MQRSLGYVTDLFMCFKSVLNFRFTYSEEFDCDNCGYNNIESNKYHGPIISITKQSRKQSFHQSYLELMQPKCYVCRLCTKKRMSISKTIEVEPEYLVIIDDNMRPTDSTTQALEFVDIFTNPETDETFEPISTINMLFQHHYNVLLRNPYLTYQNKVDGYFLHDGLTHNGRVHKIDLAQTKDLRPYIVIYKKRT